METSSALTMTVSRPAALHPEFTTQAIAGALYPLECGSGGDIYRVASVGQMCPRCWTPLEQDMWTAHLHTCCYRLQLPLGLGRLVLPGLPHSGDSSQLLSPHPPLPLSPSTFHFLDIEDLELETAGVFYRPYEH